MQDPDWIKESKIPLEFVSFALTEGSMYYHFQSDETFISKGHSRRKYGNEIVYGSLFLLQDFDFYIRLLDAYQVCSLSTLFRNHDKDLHHRIITQVTPIHFQTQDEFERLLYDEKDSVPAHVYFGNLKQPKITQRIEQKSNHSYRLYDGVDKIPFLKRIEEESS